MGTVKGDITRETFRAQRHYWGVLRQQGRVDIDADWNEQVRIGRHHDVTRTADLIGPSGGPVDGAGFGLSVSSTGAVTIGAGRYYVAGILAENEVVVPLGAQPDQPNDAVPTASVGLHLAYLDVWDRHVTALDDPAIREVALGGPDTATRARTVWQVRTQPLPGATPADATAIGTAITALGAATTDAARQAALQDLRELANGASCATPLTSVDGSLETGTGTMAARSKPGDDADDLCRFGEGGGGYTRLENRLYRVEIHDRGDDVAATAATFKWSRENGSVVVSVEDFLGTATTTTEIVVRSLGLDGTQELRQDDWIELVSDDLIARGLPGQLVRIATPPDPADRILRVTPAVEKKDLSLHPQVRRWDLPVGGLTKVTKSWQELEFGVQVKFGAGKFHTGDYWVIPARANTNDVEWPPEPEYPGHAPTGEPEQLSPRGVAHWRAPLAALVHDGTRLVASIDLRSLFPAVTDLFDFAYAGGDGQEPVLPEGTIPQPLQVSVTNGSGPIAGVVVEFQATVATDVLSGGGTTGARVEVPTGPDGLASVAWTVDRNVIDHTVVARLLDGCETPTRAPITFGARVNQQLEHLGGDGQEGLPGEAVRPLRTRVADGRWPVQGATVRFTVIEGGGSVSSTAVVTGLDGVAETTWTLGLDRTLPRQRVLAELLDPATAVVHAGLTFNANLSLAEQVSYAPAGDCSDLSGATTVGEALDMLCRREGGGDCTYTIRDGEDLVARWAEIEGTGFDSGAICFAEGTWVIDEPLRLYRRGDVTVRGLGRASRIVARKSETAFHFEGCRSVTINDLSVAALTPTTRDGLGGAIRILNSGPATVERVSVVTPSAPEPLASGIAVVRGPDSKASGPTRIHDCDLTTGEQQMGILVVNGDVVQIEGNTFQAGAFPEGTTLATYLKNARYRAAAARQLVDPNPPDRELTAVDTSPTTSGSDMIRFTIGTGTDRAGVTFRSTMRSADVWRSLLTADASTPAEAIGIARDIADTVLRNEGTYENRTAFRTWYQEVEARWQVQPLGDRAIVVAGTRADDVRIVGNVVTGHLQGISVALSADDRQVYRTRVAVIEGNTVRLPEWSLVMTQTEGIRLGSAESAIVDGNVATVGTGYTSEPALVADGIRAGGSFGARLLIRSNHMDGPLVGIRVEAIGSPPDHMRRWVASDNVTIGGSCLEAPCEMMEDANVPARSVACPIDRPI